MTETPRAGKDGPRKLLPYLLIGVLAALALSVGVVWSLTNVESPRSPTATPTYEAEVLAERPTAQPTLDPTSEPDLSLPTPTVQTEPTQAPQPTQAQPTATLVPVLPTARPTFPPTVIPATLTPSIATPTAQVVAFVHSWQLAGRHAEAQCVGCHATSAKPSTTCGSCHQQSAGLHANAAHAGPACATCHGATSESWQNVNQQSCTGSCHTNKSGHYATQECASCHSFSGQPTSFKHAWSLAGKHGATACANCHPDGGKPDASCASCHKTTGGALHTKPSHDQSSCTTCHGDAATGWAGAAPQTCLSCHNNKTSHYGGTDCASCHAFTPRGVSFQHSSWALAGKHSAAACNRCHTSGAKPSTGCGSCHSAPRGELHRKEVHIRNSCQTCHGTTYTTWVVQRESCLKCHGSTSDYREKKVHNSTTALCQSCHNKFK